MINFIKNNFSDVISLIALGLSIYNFVYNLINQKCNIKIVVHKNMQYRNTQQFFVTIQNCSQLPVSITSICLNDSNYCILEPIIIKENIRKSGGSIISRTETKSMYFPINLNSLESASGYLEFRNVNDFDIDNFFFTLFTNRKSVTIKQIININDGSSTL